MHESKAAVHLPLSNRLEAEAGLAEYPLCICELDVPGRLLRPDYPHVVPSSNIPGSARSYAARLYSGLVTSLNHILQNRF